MARPAATPGRKAIMAGTDSDAGSGRVMDPIPEADRLNLDPAEPRDGGSIRWCRTRQGSHILEVLPGNDQRPDDEYVERDDDDGP